MTKRPLRSTPPAPVPARRMYSSEDAARKAAPKPAKGQRLEITEAAPGRWSWALSIIPKPPPATARPKSRKRPARARAPSPPPAPAQPSSPKGGDA